MPFYAARVADLTWHPTATVRCLCGHSADVRVSLLQQRVALATPVSEIYHHVRCWVCGEKGHDEVDARKALGYDRMD